MKKVYFWLIVLGAVGAAQGASAQLQMYKKPSIQRSYSEPSATQNNRRIWIIEGANTAMGQPAADAGKQLVMPAGTVEVAPGSYITEDGVQIRFYERANACAHKGFSACVRSADMTANRPFGQHVMQLIGRRVGYTSSVHGANGQQTPHARSLYRLTTKRAGVQHVQRGWFAATDGTLYGVETIAPAKLAIRQGTVTHLMLETFQVR